MAYTVKYLSNFEFDNLPYKHAKEALGCADMRTKIAYVRRTGVPIADQFTTEHEIEELIAKHSDHEVDGIRYKKGGFAKTILPSVIGGLSTLLLGPAGLGLVGGSMASILGGTAGALSGGGMNYYASKRHPELGKWSPLIGAGMGALGGLGAGSMFTGAAQGAKSAGVGFMNKAGGALKGAFGMGMARPTTEAVAQKPFIGPLTENQAGYVSTMEKVSPYGKFGSPAATSQTGLPPELVTVRGSTPFTSQGLPYSNAISAGLGFGLGSANRATQTSGSSTTPIQQGVQNTGVTTGNLGTVGTQQASNVTKTGLWDKIFGTGNMGKTMLGSAVPLVGGAFAPKVQQFDPMKSQLFTDVLARVKQGNMLQLTPEQRTAITARYDQELDTAKNNIMSRWRATRPGSDITNDTELQKAISDVETQYAKEKANAVVGTEIGLTQQQTSMLSELASLDIYSMAQAAQVSVEEAKQFKEMLASMGFLVAGDSGSMFAGIRNMFQG